MIDHHLASATRQVSLRVVLVLTIVVVCVSLASAHEGDRKRKLPPTKAAANLKMARKKMDAAKKALAAQGRYSCCMKPACDVCARISGSCSCAENAKAGKGVCGECYGGWKAGQGAIRGVKADQLHILSSDHQASPHHGTPPPELEEARTVLNEAKRTLVGEGRFSCCARQGGCDGCAHEGDCACGSDLVAVLDAKDASGSDAKPVRRGAPTGVCGDCLDSWHRGHGAFPGVDVAEVPLADMGGMHMATVSGGPYQSMSAMGSGTSLLPASSPMYGWNFTAGDWFGMVMGNLRVGYNKQNGPRGVGKFESQNWAMLMLERELGPGNLQLNAMVSAEPLTTPHGGFPQLFQTGETYRDREIVDAQHPHDFLMALSAMYTIPVGERTTLQVYGAAVGEPALGPVAFMHRPSASENPAAPLGHHWQDSTHISHGVFSTGVQVGKFKFEGSAFHGAEPDDKRAGIEFGAIDSWSARVWFLPTEDWAIQVSHGRLNNPEALRTGDTLRTTASIHHNLSWGTGSWASSLIWGRNSESHGNSNAYLLESTARFSDRNSVFARVELVDKADLLRDNIWGRPGAEHGERERGTGLSGGVGPAFDHDDAVYRIGAFTFGYVRDVAVREHFSVGIGADVTLYKSPAAVDAVYGGRPTATHIFVRLRPSGH